MDDLLRKARHYRAMAQDIFTRAAHTRSATVRQGLVSRAQAALRVATALEHEAARRRVMADGPLVRRLRTE